MSVPIEQLIAEQLVELAAEQLLVVGGSELPQEIVVQQQLDAELYSPR